MCHNSCESMGTNSFSSILMGILFYVSELCATIWNCVTQQMERQCNVESTQVVGPDVTSERLSGQATNIGQIRDTELSHGHDESSTKKIVSVRRGFESSSSAFPGFELQRVAL